ncbi:hypothetical protein ABKV19_025246 [Rosa sericea]
MFCPFATWNVGRKSPHSGLNLDDFLRINNPSDIYVLGYAHFDKIRQRGFWTVYHAELTSEDDTQIVTAYGDQSASGLNPLQFSRLIVLCFR